MEVVYVRLGDWDWDSLGIGGVKRLQEGSYLDAKQLCLCILQNATIAFSSGWGL